MGRIHTTSSIERLVGQGRLEIDGPAQSKRVSENFGQKRRSCVHKMGILLTKLEATRGTLQIPAKSGHLQEFGSLVQYAIFRTSVFGKKGTGYTLFLPPPFFLTHSQKKGKNYLQKLYHPSPFNDQPCWSPICF